MKITLNHPVQEYKTQTFGSLKVGDFFVWANDENSPCFGRSSRTLAKGIKLESGWLRINDGNVVVMSTDRMNKDLVFPLTADEIILSPIFV